MKYQGVNAFYKHMQDMVLHAPSPLYLIVSGCSFERKKFAEKIATFITQSRPSCASYSFDAETHSLESILNDLNTRSLFEENKVVFFDGVGILKKWELLLNYIHHPSKNAFLILGASTMKPLSDLYQKGKKEIVVLDLSEEKPWEKENRLLQFVIQEARQHQKVLTEEGAKFLLQNVGSQMPSLQQEISKIVCFVGEKEKIELSDVRAISSSQNEVVGWQFAEKIIWGQEEIKIPQKIEDVGFILLLVGQLRYHLQQGYQLASLLEDNLSTPQIGARFPQLRGQKLDHYLLFAQKKTSTYFRKGLEALYALEVGLKSSQFNTPFLFDYFLAKLKI